MDDLTIQQRVKTLLILRAISDHNLSEAFGVGNLPPIILRESKIPPEGEVLIAKDGNYLEIGGNGQYIIGLNFSRKAPEYVAVTASPIAKHIVKGIKLVYSTESSFLSEAMHHIYITMLLQVRCCNILLCRYRGDLLIAPVY